MKYQAILLTGPTGCGKTPLGEALAQNGLRGRSCAHFDFGARLRAIADHGHSDISPAEREFIVRMLTAGALLEKESFGLAAAVFHAFIRDDRITTDHILVLNGFPRHVDQAGFMASLVDVRQVVHLAGTADVVRRRISLNSGGDRAGRNDDTPPEIEKKLFAFQQRTLPLLDYYRGSNIPVHEYQVTVSSTTDDIRDWLGGRSWIDLSGKYIDNNRGKR